MKKNLENEKKLMTLVLYDKMLLGCFIQKIEEQRNIKTKEKRIEKSKNQKNIKN